MYAYAMVLTSTAEYYIQDGLEVTIGRDTAGTRGFKNFFAISETKTISRKHLRIYWDKEHKMWMAKCMGKNGFLLNIEDKPYLPDSDPVPLKSRDLLTVEGQEMFFLLDASTKKGGSLKSPSKSGKKDPSKPAKKDGPKKKKKKKSAAAEGEEANDDENSASNTGKKKVKENVKENDGKEAEAMEVEDDDNGDDGDEEGEEDEEGGDDDEGEEEEDDGDDN